MAAASSVPTGVIVVFSAALCITGIGVWNAQSANYDKVAQTTGMVTAAVVSVGLIAAMIERIYSLPKTSNGRIVRGIQVAVLTFALMNSIGLYMMSTVDDKEQLGTLMERYNNLSAYAGFLLINIPTAYLLTVLMRYVLRFQSMNLTDTVAASAQKTVDAVTVKALATAAERVASMAGKGGQSADNLAESINALVRVLLELKSVDSTKTMQRVFELVLGALTEDEESQSTE